MLGLISVSLPKFSARQPTEFSSAPRRHLATFQHFLAADLKSNEQMSEHRQKNNNDDLILAVVIVVVIAVIRKKRKFAMIQFNY